MSVFIDAESHQIEAAKEAGSDVCEIHTGPYAESLEQNNFSISHADVETQLKRIKKSIDHVHTLGMQCNAGHGLNYHNVGRIVSLGGLSELHIGHSIVSRCVFIGMRPKTLILFHIKLLYFATCMTKTIDYCF